ncbi:hypothetical protein GGS21DRAFT_489345 [Xylaria nigripes]|nr:hypothetical protein GGS21DRAFT_489345 [Xylaria nigripes]
MVFSRFRVNPEPRRRPPPPPPPPGPRGGHIMNAPTRRNHTEPAAPKPGSRGGSAVVFSPSPATAPVTMGATETTTETTVIEPTESATPPVVYPALSSSYSSSFPISQSDKQESAPYTQAVFSLLPSSPEPSLPQPSSSIASSQVQESACKPTSSHVSTQCKAGKPACTGPTPQPAEWCRLCQIQTPESETMTRHWTTFTFSPKIQEDSWQNNSDQNERSPCHLDCKDCFLPGSASYCPCRSCHSD